MIGDTRPSRRVRSLWILHRAMVTVSGRRVGLSRPKEGKRFGMMRVNSVGRRSGRPHPVIVGDFEDRSRFDRFPGWGDDIETRVSARSKATTVVVLEPLSIERTSQT